MKKIHSFSYQARYTISHEPTGRESLILVCFHGYGQLVDYFIRKFLPFAGEKVLVIAPEGTNYQYLKDFDGRVGANWMTKYERELAIFNNKVYLDSLMSELLQAYDSLPRIAVFGFSQGAATGSRWVNEWHIKPDYLILWAGVLAHDLKIDLAEDQFRKTQILVAYGNQDEFVNEDIIRAQRRRLSEIDKEAQEVRFEGGHEILPKILEKVMAEII